MSTLLRTLRNGTLVGIVCSLGCSGTATTSPQSAHDATSAAATPQEKDARAFLDELVRHQWLAAAKRFSPKMRDTVPPEKLQAAWMQLETAAGTWTGIDDSHLEAEGALRTVVLTARFTSGRKLIRVVFDREEQIAGLWFRSVAEDLEVSAKMMIEALSRGDADAATKDFDATMRSALPPDKLAATWKALQQQTGEFVRIESTSVKSESGFTVVLETCWFARAKVVARVVFNAQGEVAGFFLLTPETAIDPVQ